MHPRLIYAPQRFRQPTLDRAREIILTSTDRLSSEERWKRETPWLMALIRPDPKAFILDFGCGIGRIAARLPNPVIGVDISPEMRAFANRRLPDDRFVALSPFLFRRSVAEGLRFDGGLAIWALQHVQDLDLDVALIAEALRPAAPLWVLNTTTRCVPVRGGKIEWLDDNLDVDASLRRCFRLDHEIPIDTTIVPVPAFFRLYRRL